MNRLKLYRDQTKTTYLHISKKVGVTFNTISTLALEQHRPNPETLWRFNLYLPDVELDWLFPNDPLHPLAAARCDQGWTRDELARRTGVSLRTLYSIETLWTIPQRGTGYKILSTLALRQGDHSWTFSPQGFRKMFPPKPEVEKTS